MKVALAAEGTYPHQFGGVSVWCDQLIRGLPQYDFTVIPLVATGNEAMRWQLPANVKSVVTIPLWGRPPAVPSRVTAVQGPERFAAGRTDRRTAQPAHLAQDRFVSVMHELFGYAQARSLRDAPVQ